MWKLGVGNLYFEEKERNCKSVHRPCIDEIDTIMENNEENTRMENNIITYGIL
jgi:hypothetical protein